jgi:hypothetical protein
MLEVSKFAPARELENAIFEWPNRQETAGRINDLMSHYGRLEPERGVALLARLPEGETKAGAAAGFAKQWGTNDPQGAGAWVRKLPAGALRDRAATGLLQALFYQPDAALECIELMSDPESRFAGASALVQQWAMADRGGALELIERAAVTDSQREQLRGRVGPPRTKPSAGQ